MSIAKKIMSQVTYDGQTDEKGLPHGYGIRSGWGRRYEGQFDHGQPSGYGRQTYLDGSRYCGEFRAGQPHGYGHYESDHGGFGLWREDSDKIDQYTQMVDGEPGEENEEQGRPAAERGQEAAAKAIAVAQSPEAQHKSFEVEASQPANSALTDEDEYDDQVFDEPENEDGEACGGKSGKGKASDDDQTEAWDQLEKMAKNVGGATLKLIFSHLRKLDGSQEENRLFAVLSG